MDNKRRLVRLDVGDFLEVQSLNEIGRTYSGKSKDITLMGVCFSSKAEWPRGSVLLIDYFIPEDLDSVRLKMTVVWSELIDADAGYFCGGEIIDIQDNKQGKFANYYFKKLKERFFI
ncbi:MAG: PilZ domain-containing protein [Candidatus Omnitrophota bacterium]